MQLARIPVSASSAPVQFRVADTTLTVRGFASPGAFVQIVDGNALIGTVIADSNGVFEKDFTAMRAGLHTLRITYEDVDGVRSDPLTQTINLRAQNDTAVEYFLPPTLLVDPVSLVEGELATFRGSSIPNSIVELILDGGTTILRPQTDARGRYSISVDTTGYYFGEHGVTASSSQGGLNSVQSLRKPFIILPIESNVGDNSNGPSALTPPIIETVDGQLTSDQSPMLIRGTGPPNAQIIIYLDGEPIGSTFTNADGTWFFNVDVLANISDLRAIACFENECSDFSNLAELIYEGDPLQCTTHRFWLREYRFWNVKENDGVNLGLTGISGTPPYEIIIDWGDAVVERFNRASAQSTELHHVYGLEGSFNGSITIVDDTGCEYTRYFSVHVIEDSMDMRWLGLIGPALVLLILALRRRHHIHQKRLILAR